MLWSKQQHELTSCFNGESQEVPTWSASSDITRDYLPLRVNTKIFMEAYLSYDKAFPIPSVNKSDPNHTRCNQKVQRLCLWKAKSVSHLNLALIFCRVVPLCRDARLPVLLSCLERSPEVLFCKMLQVPSAIGAASPPQRQNSDPSTSCWGTESGRWEPTLARRRERQLVVGGKLEHFQWAVSGQVVMLENPTAFASQFWLFAPNVLQAPQNISINSLILRDEFTMHNQGAKYAGSQRVWDPLTDKSDPVKASTAKFWGVSRKSFKKGFFTCNCQ